MILHLEIPNFYYTVFLRGSSSGQYSLGVTVQTASSLRAVGLGMIAAIIGGIEKTFSRLGYTLLVEDRQ